ncbi:fatty-acid amide hydrolase 2-B-like [Bicyclus anynana]|uniref:Fatty-acid amide hydrolase 2-B-like n=1 Tax=Bicyclus anynana TaxID=110368 RepID=A0ABM3LVY9_BICAN|nr:fatty-acid amide hydrolase 2-B-like [Bicyclus anynana]XP_052743228.1 fatty-acid amide hydrolase 2-B-like [Bicyclus anynana]XP_052743229.1 fatty-acid amide hydrolase 2-B-like [Bicyclus anynana]
MKPNPISLKTRILSAVRRIIDASTYILFKLYYGTKGDKIPPIKDFILKQPVIEVARRIRHQEISSVEVLNTCIQRIKETNPILNYFIDERFKLALEEAKEADNLIRNGTLSTECLARDKPFLGVPFTTKDSIGVKGLRMAVGVTRRKNIIADKDADVIQLLKNSGAIIMGLTNVPELCMWYETHNHLYGRTLNPYNTTRIVGGSSGGEGVIQAVGGSIFGIGSDIGGSIRMPAFFNGIFGHKPTRRAVSNQGQYPELKDPTIDLYLSIGPMTRYAVDLKHIQKVISGDYAKNLNLDQPVDIQTLKIFYQFSMDAPMMSDVDPEIEEKLKKVVEHFRRTYNMTAEEKKIEWLQRSSPIWMQAVKSSDSFADHILPNPSTMSNIIEIIKSIFGLSENTLAGLLVSLSDQEKFNPECKKYKYFMKARDYLEEVFKNMLGDNGVFLFPTHPVAAPYHNQPLVRGMNFMYTAIINSLGFPATAIPLGFNKEGLPIGIQVVANINNDRLCFAVTEELEKAFGGWVEAHGGN